MRRTEQERFWQKVDKTGECWLWTAKSVMGGYGAFRLASPGPYKIGKLVRAHRYAYEQLVGPIPEGLQLDHLCRNPPCVNPAHLEPVTAWENILRGESPFAQRARQTHCKRGHELTEENIVRQGPGGRRRMCRPCSLAWSKERHLAEREGRKPDGNRLPHA